MPLSKTGAELLFEVFSRRYERSATLVASNLPFNESTEAFGSERLTGALLDQLHASRPHLGDERGKLPNSKTASDDAPRSLAPSHRLVYGADLQGRLPLRPKRAPQSGSQAYAPAAPANPSKQSPNFLGSGLLSLRPGGLFLLRP